MPNPGTTWTYDYTGKEQVFSVPVSGIYKLEVWGASGGCSLTNGTTTCNDIGYGGYSTAMTSLNRNSSLYTNVGGKGTNGSLGKNAPGGYNGGGYGTWDNNDDETSGGGGGATHIATSSGLLSTLKNNIDNILIVAGGGGGKSFTYAAGSGGGFNGGILSTTNQSEVSQTKGYSFGQGQNASGVADQDGVGGGGGGFYGGYMNNVAKKSSGSGGSGYIGNTNLINRAMYCYKCKESNEETTKTISTTNVSEQAISYYAKKNNGYAKITLLVNSDYALELDKIKPTVKVSLSGKKATFTFEDNVGISGYGVNQSSTEEPDYISTNDLTTTWTAPSAGTYYVWVKDIAKNITNISFTITSIEFCEYNTGKQWTYSYTGGVQSFTVPCSGTYKLEVWGGEGENNGPAIAGKGGYAKGNTILTKDEILYIVCGGGNGNTYNGGGSAPAGCDGGGLTHIAKVSGTLSSIGYKSAITDKNLLLCAGGGGGAGTGRSDCNGGSGGGSTGGYGSGENGTLGGVGTQTSGYAFGKGQSGGSNMKVANHGGGGGLYGGYAGGTVGSGYQIGGSGGSGYIGGVTDGSMQNGVRSGNGYARITLVSISN